MNCRRSFKLSFAEFLSFNVTFNLRDLLAIKWGSISWKERNEESTTCGYQTSEAKTCIPLNHFQYVKFQLNTTQSFQETDFSKELTLTKQQLKQRQNHQTNHFRSENFSSYATNPCITEKHSTRIKTSIIFSIQKQFISSKSVIDTSA